jgi:hypothetical protein
MESPPAMVNTGQGSATTYVALEQQPIEVAKAVGERYGISKNRVKRFLLDAEKRGGLAE